jgi:Flp pilus assembly protein TadG
MVEFAVVAPLFFMALFGSVDGGLLMFSAGAINHSAGLGMIELAQDGNSTTADAYAVGMVVSGSQTSFVANFSSTGFAKIDEVDIYLTHVDPVTGAVTQDTNSCGGAACVNRYNAAGGALGTNPWSSALRSTQSGALTTAGITVKCHYSFMAFNTATINLSQTRYFRLEPQS